jgi:DNA-binding beta-propeller fold protein YncE
MRRHHTLFLALAAFTVGLAAGPLGAAQAPGSYAKIGEVPIGGSGGFDYLNVDSAAKRLYVTHGTEVVVIDLSTNSVVGKLGGDFEGVHGIAFAPNGHGFVSSGRDNKVAVVDLKTLQTITKVDTGLNPDAILYEPKQKEIYALNHTGKSATVINADTNAVVATIPLAGQAETGQADPALGRVYVNIEDKDSIDVIDIATHKVIASWPVAPAEGPTGMAIDTATHRLFVGGGPNMVMIDGQSGKVVASAPICTGTDATWFDAGTKMAFSSCSDGHITAVHMDAPDKLTVVQTIETERGARTMTGDPATHNLYVAAQKYQPADPNAPPPAAGQRARGPAAIPDSLHALILGIKK